MPRLAPGMFGVLRRIVHGQPGAIVSERLGAISLYEYSPVLAFISKTAPNSCSPECRSGFSGQPGILAAVPASLRKLSAASRPAARRASAPSLALSLAALLMKRGLSTKRNLFGLKAPSMKETPRKQKQMESGIHPERQLRRPGRK